MKRKLFEPKSHPHGTVVLNWHGTPEEEFTFFAEAFHLTAKEAVAALRRDPHFGLYGSPHKDFRAYPIVFLYRHALELYMKAVILVGAPMVSIRGIGRVDRDRILKTHRLDVLRVDLERVFEALEWEFDFGVPHFHTLVQFRALIAELDAIDAGSHSFRYPIDTKGQASLPHHFRFNLFEFSETLDRLLPVFDGAATGAYEAVQATYEAMAEGQQAEWENADYDEGQQAEWDNADYEPE